jgi:hypothetical protein
MRKLRWSLAVLVVSLVLPAIGFAQQPQPAVQPVVQPSNVNVQVNNYPTAPVFVDGGEQHLFDIKVMLGLPTAVRLEIPFQCGSDFSYSVEGTIGFFPGYFSDETFYSLGARASYTLNNNFLGGHLQIGPGVDLLYFGGNENALALTGSVEFVWLSEFNSRFGWELGLDAGIGVGLADFDHHDRAGEVFPVISVFTGLRF